MDKSCNGQQTRSLTSQFRESTYRALTLLRRKAKQRQIAGKLCREAIVFAENVILTRHRVSARRQRVGLLEASSTARESVQVCFQRVSFNNK